MKDLDFIKDFKENFASMYPESNTHSELFFGLTLGVVVSGDDPLQQGRLQVFCPSLGDDPDKPAALPWCAYVMPFGGVINNSSYVRGPKGDTTDGPVHYGFWGIPEMGAHVLVGCIDGDFRRRFWVGSVPAHQETNTILTGKYKWGGGSNPDGPLSGTGSPLEPQYTNLSTAFEGDRDSQEWKTRGGDYPAAVNRRDEGSRPNDDKGASYMDSIYEDVDSNEKMSEAKPGLGDPGYDWSNFGNIAGNRSSKTYGFSTPGGHSIHCDDRTYNSRIRIRSSGGHTVLLDDTNERIYVMTAEGNSYVELDQSGNVDVYAKRRLSVHAEKDINFSTDETFRVHAKKGIHMYSGNTLGQEELESIPNDGEIRFHATNDIHVISEKNIRVLSIEDTLVEVGANVCLTVGGTMSTQVQSDVNFVINSGDYNFTVNGNVNELVTGTIRRYSLGETRNLADGNMQTHSFGGKMDIGSREQMNIKSIGSDVMMEAVGRNESGVAGVYMKAPTSLISIDTVGISNVTTGIINSISPTDFQVRVDDVDLSPPDDPSIPDIDCEGAGSDPIPLDGLSGPDLAAAAAYNAGFRGQDLVTMVAIAGAESGYNPNAVNPKDARTDKRGVEWGPSVGMWQVRTLPDPENWSGLDRQRDINTQLGPSNISNNANIAKRIHARSGFNEWSVYANGNGPYRQFLGVATAAVNNLCGGGGGGSGLLSDEQEFSMVFSSFGFSANCAKSIATNSCTPDFSFKNNTSLSLNVEGINLQSQVDTIFKSVANDFSTKLHDNIISTIDSHSDSLNKVTGALASFAEGIAGAASGVAGVADMIATAAGLLQGFDIQAFKDLLGPFPISLNVGIQDFLPNIGFEHLLGDICKVRIPAFDYSFDASFSLAIADICSRPAIDPDTGDVLTDPETGLPFTPSVDINGQPLWVRLTPPTR